MLGRRLVIGAAVAAVLSGGVAVGTASAGTVGLGLDYTCGPGIVVHADVTAVVPDEGMAGGNVPYLEPAYIDVDVAFTLDRAPVGVRIDGDSTASLAATVVGPAGTTATAAALSFAPTLLTSSGGLVKAAGGFPALTVYPSGSYAIHLGDLTLSLRPERADGTPAGPAVTATCRHSGPDLLTVVKSESTIVEHPVRPSQLQVTAVTPTSVSLSWYSTSWWFPTIGYDVFLDGVKVAFVTDKQATLTGLGPDTQHRVKVTTRDSHGFSSPKSQGLVFATPPLGR
ncbi:MAG: fibronectin type III domain-containing protein [Saccharothrix sp.]|nr:fibronectin type III domain-containing protein [Saccharothrix sp.]